MNDVSKSGIKIFAHGKLGTLPLTQNELIDFLETPELLIHLGTVDKNGEPDDVRPTWYYYDSMRQIVRGNKQETIEDGRQFGEEQGYFILYRRFKTCSL